MDQDFDLFGNPISVAGKTRGRPPHTPTEENIINIMVLLAGGMTKREVTKVVGLDVKTFDKYYSHLVKSRDVLLNRLRTKLRTSQIQQGLAGNAAALSGALKMLDSLTAEGVERKYRGIAANAPAPQKLGKKEKKTEDARNIGGKFAPPAPPPRLVSSGGLALSADQDN